MEVLWFKGQWPMTRKIRKITSQEEVNDCVENPATGTKMIHGCSWFVFTDFKLQSDGFFYLSPPSAVGIVKLLQINVIMYCTCYKGWWLLKLDDSSLRQLGWVETLNLYHIVVSVYACNQPVGSWLDNARMGVWTVELYVVVIELSI